MTRLIEWFAQVPVKEFLGVCVIAVGFAFLLGVYSTKFVG